MAADDTFDFGPNFDLLGVSQSFLDEFLSTTFQEEKENIQEIVDLPNDLLEELLKPFEASVKSDPCVPQATIPTTKCPTTSGPTLLSSTQSDVNTINNEPGRKNETSDINVDSFIDAQQKKNTKKTTEKDVKNAQRWLLSHKKESTPLFDIPATILNEYLAEMFISIRQSNGKNYEPSSLDGLKNSIDRHLKSNGYPYSLRDRIFTKANQALTAKKTELKKQGHGNKPNAAEAVTQEDENLMYEKGVMGWDKPEALQFSIFYHFGKNFGLRGRDEQRKLKFGDVTLKKDSGGTEFLEYMERDSKTIDGTKSDATCRSTKPRIFSSGEKERNPIELYKKFVSMRPAEMTLPESPFYLGIKPIGNQGFNPAKDVVWYTTKPMGVNYLGRMVKNAATESGIEHKRLTNHSVRKTCVTKLSKSGMGAHKIIQVTGHKSTASVAAYDSALTVDEQKKISQILNEPCQTVTTECKTTTSTTITPPVFPLPATPRPALSTINCNPVLFTTENSVETTMQQVNESLFKGAFIQTLNLNIIQK